MLRINFKALSRAIDSETIYYPILTIGRIKKRFKY